MTIRDHARTITPLSLMAAAFAFAGALGACSSNRGASTSARPAPAPAPASASTPADSAPMTQVNRSVIRERSLQILLDAAISPVPVLRANALEGLQAAPSRAETLIRVALKDENPGVRFVACMVAGRTKLRGTSSIVADLLADSDPRVRAAAMLALTRFGQRVNISPLAGILEHPDLKVRSEAARVLGEMDNPSAAPMLRAAASSRMGNDVESRLFRLHVAQALARLGEPGVVDALRAALYPSTPEEYEVAVVAVQMLGELKEQKSAAQLVRIVEDLQPGATGAPATGPRAAYLHPKELRLAAAGALARMGFPDGGFVADAHANDPDPLTRQQAAIVFGDLGRPGSLGKLERMQNDENPQVRVAAAAAALRILDRR